jgi:putative two-component system response regulator
MGSAHAERLETLLSSSTALNDAELKAALSRLSNEAKNRLARSSDSGDFFLSALLALGRIKGAAHADLRISCLWDCAQYFYHSGDLEKALNSAKALTTLAAHTDQKMWLRRALMMMGIVNADNGNVAEALPFYLDALEHAISQGDLEGEASVLINTGVALNYGALYREAIPCFRKAIDLARAANLDSYLPRIYINLAQSHHNLDQIQEGFDAARVAIESSSAPNDIVSAISAITREYTYVQLALELGKLSTAREHARLCASHAQWCGSRRGKALSDIATGLCEVYGGKVEKGFGLLETALLNSRDIDSIRSVALVALVRAYDAANQPEQALKHLRMLLEHKRATRSKSVAALFTLSDSAQISCVPGEIDLRAYEFKEARLRASVAEREVLNSRFEMLERFAVTADLKEEESGEHGYRVGKLAELMTVELKWVLESRRAIEMAARLHDIGKLGVPDRILLNSVELKEAERHFMSSHTIIGAELLAKSNIPQLRMAEEIARHHHEWWNGEGYPSRLSGKRIPIHARIVALADVFDALTHGRPFAKPWPMDRALEEIRNRRGTQFDPELTDVFLALVQRLRTEHQDLDEYLGRAGRGSPFLQARNKIRLMLAEERENEKKATVEGNETRH